MGYQIPEAEPILPVRGDFGRDEIVINKFKIELDNARESVAFDFPQSNAVWVMESSDNEAKLEIQFNMQRNSKITLQQNAVIKGFNFGKSYLTNTAQSGKYVTLVCFYIKKDSSFNIENFAKSFDEVNLVTPTDLSPFADVSAGATAKTQIMASNANRKKAVIHNHSTTDVLRVGDTNVTATKGLRLMPEQSLEMEITDEIYVYNNTAGAITVSGYEINS